MRNKLLIVSLLYLIGGCSTLASFAMDAISPSKGGINTEIVVGDKEQTLGTNQDVKANSIGTVVGQNDNSTDIASAKEVVVNNTTYPAWLMIVLLIGNVVFLCLPTPTSVFNYFRRKK